MHVMLVSSEVSPYSSDSGLGVLVSTLAQALREAEVKVTILTPFYSSIPSERYALARRLSTVSVTTGAGTQAEIRLIDGKFPSADVDVVFVDHPESFDRKGLYGDGANGPYSDNHRRFDLLCRSVPPISEELHLAPDLIHSFDWQTGLLPLLLRHGKIGPPLHDAKRVFTVSDAGLQGLFGAETLTDLGLGNDLFHPDGIEFHGQVSLLKAGLISSDRVCVPSATYARELCTEEQGGGLHGLFNALAERLVGVSPGVDYSSWNPAADHRLPAHFEIEDLSGKAECKRQLQTELGLPARPQIPLVLTFEPFSDSEIELLLSSLPQAPQLQLVLVGGDSAVEKKVAALELPDSEPACSVVFHRPRQGVDPVHRLLAGADAVLFPARHEPGGHVQLKALRYGAVPVATAVGGLRDTVVDFDHQTGTGTGVLIHRLDADGLLAALARLTSLHNNEQSWATLTQNAMRQRFDASVVAGRYLEVYKGLVGQEQE